MHASHRPASLAIAGAWGYIGRKFLHAAAVLRVRTYALDLGPTPTDVDRTTFQRIDDEEEFYHLPAEMFHLALHPEHRRLGLDVLLARGRVEPLIVLCEKPMASPERPGDTDALVAAAANLRAALWFDFPELFDPITRRIEDFLASFDDVRIERMRLVRSKDREDPANPRNRKRMVPIQYQESVHCAAFALNILGLAHGSVDAALAGGVTAQARSEPYRPPNPEDYPYVVDGRCEYELALGGCVVAGDTNFRRGAPLTKLREIHGRGDGEPFSIEAEYLEGAKWLKFNGAPQDVDPAGSSYEAVLQTAARWHEKRTEGAPRTRYPDAAFARHTYRLSSVLWRSSFDRRAIALPGAEALDRFDAGFAGQAPHLPRYA